MMKCKEEPLIGNVSAEVNLKAGDPRAGVPQPGLVLSSVMGCLEMSEFCRLVFRPCALQCNSE